MRPGYAMFAAGLLAAASATNVGAQTASAPDTVRREPVDTLYQTYEDPAFSLPLGVGLRIPSYDRVNGLSLPWGPKIRVPGGRILLDPTVTYRSNLGKFDPAISATVALGHVDSLTVYGGTGTFTNDAWIRSDIVNSLAAIGVGSDSRNYFRSDRVTAELSHAIKGDAWTTSVWVGGLHEFDWATGLLRPHGKSPWSFFGRTDSLKMKRINPYVRRDHITSGLAGIDLAYDQPDLKGKVSAKLEHAFDGPHLTPQDDGNFTQATIHVTSEFPTFGTQSFVFRGHAVTTSGSAAPPQRFAYLGGAGTLATVDLLALGGDRLVYVEGEYFVPLPKPVLPFVGPPVLSARYAAGSAGIDNLPDFIQNIGVGLGVKLVKVEYHVDPNYRKTPYTHKHAFAIGFSLSL